MALSIITLAYCIMLFSGNVVEGTIGLNWGRMANQRLIPSMVVDLFLQNGIPEVKVFSASENVMKAFSGSGIGLTIAIPNESLHEINSTDGARDWVRTKITNFVNMNVDIKYVLCPCQRRIPCMIIFLFPDDGFLFFLFFFYPSFLGFVQVCECRGGAIFTILLESNQFRSC